MDTLEYEARNYQCINCGEIHRVDINKVFDYDDLYYETYCPVCRVMCKHLDIGQDESDRYLYYDPVLDHKYY